MMEGTSQTVRHFKIETLLWPERIVAAYSESERMEGLFQRPDYYERVTRLCVPWSEQESPLGRMRIGKALSDVIIQGLSKRELAASTGLTYIEAQQIMNRYQEVFYKSSDWQKKVGVKEAWALVSGCIEKLLEESTTKAIASLPKDWNYSGDLTYRVPSYGYEVEVEKYFRHHYEREIEIRDKMLKLPIAVSYD